MSVRKLFCLLLGAGLVMVGCRASVKADINASANAKSSEEFNEPLSDEKGDSESDFGSAEQALLGARHDLTLAPEKKTPTCRCLAAAVGGPGDPAFKWQGGSPKMDPATQLVVAVSSEGMTCEGEKPDSLGASYWGYRLSGDDVVVIIENARFGRPITQGAIIPRPIGAGQVYVKPAGKDVPYGGSLSASDPMCKLGNPGPSKGVPAGSMDQTLKNDTGGL